MSAPQELPTAVCPWRVLPSWANGFDEAFWDDLSGLELSENLSGRAPQQATWMKLAWDDHEWRVLFLIEDREPWATLTERDAPLYQEEVVEVFFDPVGDLLSYYEIEVNPLNAVCDLVLRQTRSGWRKDFAWNCDGLRTRADRTERGWRVEMAIPFTAVAAGPPANGAVWRANFLRIDRPTGEPRELSAWSPTGIAQFHVAARFGCVAFAR